MKKIFYVFIFLFAIAASAQDKIPISSDDYENQEVEMADTMRQDGKIYIVVAVVLIVLLGLIGYTVHLDFKISKLEKGKEIEI